MLKYSGKMIKIKGGTFRMGHDFVYDPAQPDNLNFAYPNEQLIHDVSVSSFEIGETLVTQDEYLEMTGENPSLVKGGRMPVTHVTAEEALALCNKLSVAAGYEPCYDAKTRKCDISKSGYRLPTEAEWEFACRAGTTSHFYTGDKLTDLSRAGWHLGNSGGTIHPVAQKEPNAFGLYDMHGNVFEWCYDGYDWIDYHGGYTSKPATNPIGFEDFRFRVIRGGSWFSEPSVCRSAARGNYYPKMGNYYIGVRLARRI